jgi:hypothetical protein
LQHFADSFLEKVFFTSGEEERKTDNHVIGGKAFCSAQKSG